MRSARRARLRQLRRLSRLSVLSNFLPSSAVSQFPTRTPKRLTPLTRRMPAARSGLSRPQSDASYASRRIAANLKLIVAAQRGRAARHKNHHRRTGRLSNRLCGLFHGARVGRPEYDATVGATVRFQRDYDGKQPGDPVKAAAALLYIASLPNPPLRLLLGSDAYNAAEQHGLQILGFDKEWKDLSISTDYKVPNFV